MTEDQPEGGTKVIHLTEEQMDEVAERAAKKVFAIFYQEVGRSVVKKLLWLTGITIAGLAILLAGKGALPK